MITTALKHIVKGPATRAMALRGGIVGLNFAVMMGLAAVLGLEAFGGLAVLWGGALVAASVLSCGAPLLLLQRMTDGGVVRWRALAGQMFLWPAALALAAVLTLGQIWPAVPWEVILAAGFCINLLNCLSSIMRGLGSIQMSMAVRDAAPQLALFCAGVLSSETGGANIVTFATLGMVSLGAAAFWWCWRHPRRTALIGPTGRLLPLSAAHWGTSVMGMALTQIDIIVGGSLMSAEQIGLYAILRRIANLIALPVSVATWVSAAPISAAHGRHDAPALQGASRRGSQIAFIPGMVLFALAMISLPLLQRLMPGADPVAFAILMAGAFAQIIFASGFTVATLCARAHLAAVSRAISIGAYLAAAAVMGSVADPLLNALAYSSAVTLGSVLLWWGLRRGLGIDTSAAALLPGRGVSWKPS